MYLALRWDKEDASRFEILNSGWRSFVIRQVNENVINIRLDNKTAILKLIYARASTSGFLSHSLTPSESFHFVLLHLFTHQASCGVNICKENKARLIFINLSIFSKLLLRVFVFCWLFTLQKLCWVCNFTPQTAAVRVNVYFLLFIT